MFSQSSKVPSLTVLVFYSVVLGRLRGFTNASFVCGADTELNDLAFFQSSDVSAAFVVFCGHRLHPV